MNMVMYLSMIFWAATAGIWAYRTYMAKRMGQVIPRWVYAFILFSVIGFFLTALRLTEYIDIETSDSLGRYVNLAFASIFFLTTVVIKK